MGLENFGAGSATGVVSLNGETGAVSLTSASNTVSITPSGSNIDLEVESINGLLAQGTNVTITGSGTAGSPYTIAASGGGTPGGSSGQFQYNNGGVFGGAAGVSYSAGNLLLNSGGYSAVCNSAQIITDNTSLTLEQTGDVFGPSSLSLQARSGSLGALFSTIGAIAPLVDFGFTAITGLQSNFRYECRTVGGTIGYGNSTYGEFQYIMNSTVLSDYFLSAIIGEQTIAFFPQPGTSGGQFFDGNVGISVNAPQAKFHIQIGSTSGLGQIIQGYAGQTADLQQWQNSGAAVLSNVDCNGAIASCHATTVGRPTVATIGAQVFDTTLGIPIWWNGSAYVNALGTPV